MIGFGVCSAQDGMRFAELKETISEAEKLGFDSFWLFDHLYGFPLPSRQPFLESWTTLSALSTLTKRIRLGTLVTNIQYRLPSLIAKMAATLDLISCGRSELGLGAGGTGRAAWHQKLGYIPEYAAYGTCFPEKPSTRIRRLDEAAEMIKLMWTKEQATYDGAYYRIKSAACDPRPIQIPHPRIWIAGGGEKLLLRVAARRANGTNFAWDLSPEDFRRKLSILREHCKTAGTDFTGMIKSLSAGVLIANEESQMDVMKKDLMRQYLEMEGYVPYALRKSGLVGTPHQCEQKLKEFVETGAEYFMLVFNDLNQMKLFAETVLPQFS